MCGIGGYLGDGAGLSEEALIGQLAHRGPDQEGRLRLHAADGTPVLLGFRRLAILDLSAAGNQPMTLQTNGATLALVYNGEVYNFRALRDELVGLGHSFRSTSDTEVVLRGWAQWGADLLPRLRGMFAFALWDGARQELVLCRDRLGIKPLYYSFDGRRLVFGSELRTLLAAGAVPARLDPMAVHGFLALGSVPQPRTLIRGVSLLLPGHLLRVRVSGGRALPPQEQRYFRLPPPRPRAQDRGQLVAEVGDILREAVRLRLIADVPVGVLLSGGIDSSAVLLLGRREIEKLWTFTLSYGDEQAESEGGPARLLAQTLSTEHRERVETSASIVEAVPSFHAAMDQPSVDGFNTYLVAHLVRQSGLKVALSGLGGDEVFLGYEMPHVFARLSKALGLLGPGLGAGGRLVRELSAALPAALSARLSAAPLWAQKGAAVLGAAAADPSWQARGLYAALRGLLPQAQLDALLAPDLGLRDLEPAAHVRCDLPAPAETLAPLDLVSYLDIDNYLSNTLLRDSDVMSMAHGVELRVPLCDHVLVSHVLALGAAARVEHGRQKPLLVDASKSPLIAHIAGRKKRGFVLPLGTFLRQELRAQVQEVMLDAQRVRAAGLQPDVVAGLFQALQTGKRADLTWRIWGIFNLLSWVRLHGASL